MFRNPRLIHSQESSSQLTTWNLSAGTRTIFSSEMFEELSEHEWLFTAWDPCLLLISVAAIAILSLAASFAVVVVKASTRVRNFDGPPCHWFKGHLDKV